MDLSSEDTLRLNVLLHQDLQAVRIDESKMLVHALTGKGEAKVALKPNCRDEKYLRMVREMLSTHALGSPGGYPVYLRRWTRMGEIREESLQGLLLLGESEAIVAVANSPNLNEEVARRAWWAMPDADIARRMLRQKAIAQSELGKELAAYLVDYLPFESEANNIVESVRLVLQPGLIDEATINSLWSRALRKSAYYVGFLLATPDALPQESPQSVLFDEVKQTLESEQGNLYAEMILHLHSAAGQSFLSTLLSAMDRLSDQHVTVLYLKALQQYFRSFVPDSETKYREFSEIEKAVTREVESSDNPELETVLTKGDKYKDWVRSMLALSLVGEPLADPIFSQTDAVGSVMRKRLLPVTEPIAAHIRQFISR